MQRKGIILAGGSGTRLHPSTIAVSKQLMPVFDKPMIYYPLSVLMQAGINDLLIITTPHDRPAFEKLLGDGASWGVSITFLEQTAPNGIAEALIIGEEWLDGAPCALILGDNLFFGKGFTGALDAAMDQKVGALIFAYRVNNPGDYGVVGFETDGTAREIVEKSANPPSDFAVTGLYLYDHRASALARALTPSGRGELEITDLNMAYLKDGSLAVERLDEATTWLDTGTHRSLLAAAQFVSVIEERQGIRIGCPEEAAFRRGWIDRAALVRLAEAQSKSGYGAYLLKVAGSSKGAE